MTIGAYRGVQQFAYPGWRLTVPGGPAGGHYKGFTHTQAAGTTLLPADEYEQDRGDGMSSHDAVHATRRNPRGVYRSSGEVPPRPNASGSAHRVRSFQTQRHPGQAVAPGSFPGLFDVTDEDAFLHRYDPHGLGVVMMMRDDVNPEMIPTRFFPGFPGYVGPIVHGPIAVSPQLPPNTISLGPVQSPPPSYADVPPPVLTVPPPATGATSVVNQPPATPAPLPPSPAVPVYVAPPVSPAPAPVVNTNQVVPLNDGSGNYLNVSTGTIIPASAVAQNPATGQLTSAASSAVSGTLSWLEQPSSFFPSIPNWGLLAGAAVLAGMMMGGKHR